MPTTVANFPRPPINNQRKHAKLDVANAICSHEPTAQVVVRQMPQYGRSTNDTNSCLLHAVQYVHCASQDQQHDNMELEIRRSALPRKRELTITQNVL
ncbi:hypothetical protein Ae201684P_009375 [Aphanomyces euteiches]|uniref:Uncharacterized protein n=1 Tax=Aphanomyces euteiches TaxID=100861 RepID=A0A6G0WNI1_9STRA|nr:hypothetical protein Ae201684_013468 [Aphanomyces euteiches]KAH9063111.1 hypothetical protein Ae201684P_009375 [Aphanomyces euteiches]